STPCTEAEKQALSIVKPHPKSSEVAMRVVRGMSQSLCIVLLLSTCSTLSAQNEKPPVRNIVLVHGAWADGFGWKGVYDILVKDVYKVSIVQEPETSIPLLPDEFTSPPTCRMRERMKPTTENDSRATSASPLR